jgi:hypothetical protein
MAKINEPGLTFEEQNDQTKYFLNKLGVPVKNLNKQELESELIDFLKQPQCLSLATVNPDGTPHQTLLDYVSDGLDIDGTAKVYKAPHPKFVGGMIKMKSFLENWYKAVQPLENIIKRAVTARVIVITPDRMAYMNMPKGVPWLRWEK